jgi:hypothetical protein
VPVQTSSVDLGMSLALIGPCSYLWLSCVVVTSVGLWQSSLPFDQRLPLQEVLSGTSARQRAGRGSGDWKQT